MNRWGAFVARRARAVLAVSIVLVAAAAVFGLGVFGALSDGGFEDPAAESSRAGAAIQDTFPDSSADLVVVYSSPDLTVADPAFRGRRGGDAGRARPRGRARQRCRGSTPRRPTWSAPTSTRPA